MPPHDVPNTPTAHLLVSHETLALARHELRTPLSAILGHAQLLQRRLARFERLTEPNRAALNRHAAAIEIGCRTLAAVIDRLDPDHPAWSASVAQASGRPHQGSDLAE